MIVTTTTTTTTTTGFWWIGRNHARRFGAPIRECHVTIVVVVTCLGTHFILFLVTLVNRTNDQEIFHQSTIRRIGIFRGGRLHGGWWWSWLL